MILPGRRAVPLLAQLHRAPPLHVLHGTESFLPFFGLWAWTDCHGNPENVLTRDEMLDDIMLYWLPNAAAASARLYWESFNKFNYEPVRIPVGCSIFPKDVLRVSRRWAEKRYPNLVYWNRLDRGGHFAAFEQPDLFVKELRACFGKMRAM
jgi:pimeloyl-ACP methyl ester carboxylesterase